MYVFLTTDVRVLWAAGARAGGGGGSSKEIQ